MASLIDLDFMKVDLANVDLGDSPSSADYRRVLRDLQSFLSQCVGFEPKALSLRLELLIAVGTLDLGLARLVEGHLDAVSILDEAGVEPEPDALYGIWASGGPADTTQLATRSGETVLNGSKPFCSGAQIVDRALVWVNRAEALVEISLLEGGVSWDDSSWQVDAMAGVNTWTATFNALPLARHVGSQPSGWYFERPGFWLGALCPPACWLGGALGLVNYALVHAKAEPLADRQLGAMLGAIISMHTSLFGAIDERDMGSTLALPAYGRALAARHSVEDGSLRLMTEFHRLFGPRPLVADRDIARRLQELSLYIRQCHGDKDLAELGRVGREAFVAGAGKAVEH